MQSPFFELIQVSIGSRETLSRIPSAEEWEELYDIACKQAVAGVAFYGITKCIYDAHKKGLRRVKKGEEGLENRESKQSSLETKTKKTPIDSFDSVNLNDEVCISQNINEFSSCENQSLSTPLAVENESIGNKQELNSSTRTNNDNEEEEEFDESWLEAVNLPEELYYTWMQQAMDIQKRNQLMDKRCIELQERLKKDGFNSCILKGQGVARLYPTHLAKYRTSGDIDVWIEGNIHNTVKRLEDSGIKLEHIGIKHAMAKFFDDAEVEVHFNPTWLYNPIAQNNYKRWLSATSPKQFAQSSNIVEIHTPSIDFNIIYLLIHVYKHLFNEGVGLRQVMDYYFVLRTVENVESVEKVKKVIKELGLEKFAAAMLWVIAKVFANEDELLSLKSLKGSKGEEMNSWMLWKPNEKEGKFLLNEIMRGGNFGKYDSRNNHKANEGIMARNWRKIKRSWRFLGYYPQEVLWIPCWKLWHWGWRKWYGYL